MRLISIRRRSYVFESAMDCEDKGFSAYAESEM